MWHIAKSLNVKRHIIFLVGFIFYTMGSIIQLRTASEQKAPVMKNILGLRTLSLKNEKTLDAPFGFPQIAHWWNLLENI